MAAESHSTSVNVSESNTSYGERDSGSPGQAEYWGPGREFFCPASQFPSEQQQSISNSISYFLVIDLSLSLLSIFCTVSLLLEFSQCGLWKNSHLKKEIDAGREFILLSCPWRRERANAC